MTPELFLICGMPRSGSTFSFNITRDILIRRGKVHQEVADSFSSILASSEARFIVIKSHNFQEDVIEAVEDLRVRAICTIRKPEDAVASWMETFNMSFDRAIHVMHVWLELFARIHNNALLVRYDEIERAPVLVAMKINEYIDGYASAADLEVIANKYTKRIIFEKTARMKMDDANLMHLGFSFYDKDSFFHRNHVSSLISRTAEERIGLDAVLRIREIFAGHLSPDAALGKALREASPGVSA